MFTGYWHNIDHILSDTNMEGNSNKNTIFIIKQDKHIQSYIYSLPRVGSCDTESHPYFKVIGQTKLVHWIFFSYLASTSADNHPPLEALHSFSCTFVKH